MSNYVSYINVFHQNHGVNSVEDYIKRNLTWCSKNAKISDQTLFIDATYEVEEILEEIAIRFIKSNHDSNISTKLRHFKKMPYIEEQRHRKFGRCYTFRPDTRMQQLGIYYITLKL